MDKGLTVLNLSAQIVCPSPKVWDFDEKRLHWVSVVCDLIIHIFAGEEVGDAVSLARRIRQKQSVSYTQTNFNVNAKRAQSVESMLDRIPNVGIHHGGISPHSELGKLI